MKPSERYRQIKAEIPNRYLGIKEPFITERALLDLLDELHPEPADDGRCECQGGRFVNVGCPLCVDIEPAPKPQGPPPLPPLPQPK